MMQSRRRTDDQGQHGEPDRAGIDPSSVMQELMRAAADRVATDRAVADRAAAALAHSRGLPQPQADDVVQSAIAARPMSERLALAEARFRALASVAGHATWTADASGRMTDRHAAWKAFTGQSSMQLLPGDGYDWTDALHPDDRDATARHFREAIAAGMPFELLTRARQAQDDGVEWRRILIRAAPVRSDAGAVVEWIGMNSDAFDAVRAHVR